MTRVRWYQSFIAGGIAAILLAILFPACGEDRQQQLRSAPDRGRRQHLGFDIDIQREGPLLDGTRVTLLEAKNATPYRLAIPPVNPRTGNLPASG